MRIGAAAWYCVLALLLAQAEIVAQTNMLIPKGAVWRYLDDGSEPAVEWTFLDYNHASWNSGTAPLGYGEPGVISTPTTPGRQINYFRHTFNLTSVPAVPEMTFRLWRDDWAKLYINGIFVHADDEARLAEWQPPYDGVVVPAAYLQTGPNVVAVEVHQANISSSDLVFDFALFYTNVPPPPEPGVAIFNPTNDTIVRIGTNLSIEAIVTAMSNVTQVRFYEDDVLIGTDHDSPYGIVWSNVPGGDHLLIAVAVSPSDTAVSDPVRVTAVANIPPYVQITSPADNSIVHAGDLVIRATAWDSDGNVTNVAFFEDGTKLGDSASPPYEFVWSDVDPGQYVLTASANDNEGLSVTSAAVRIEARTPPPANLVRGPYLQVGTPTNVIVKWRTDVPSTSRVRYGTSQGNLNQEVNDSSLVVNHELKLSGLQPDTKYWYEIGTATAPLAAGADYFFVTAPPQPKPTRVWVIGDSGTATEGARAVADAYKAFTGSRYTDLWLMLGDNAYGSGTDTEYQRAVFDFYPDMLRQVVLWPTIGNHDASFDYFDIFTLPTQGEAGGLASGSERFYSFDYGNIHFICLDAAYSARGSNDIMCTWLRADLAANASQWTIAFWHHPPYSKGSHNSDVEFELIQMRENAVPILEEYGVDLVLCGHSHCYERSYLMHGHYGDSSTLNPATMFVNAGSGRPDEDGPYRKATTGPNAEQGAVYVVAGSSGWATFGQLDHPAMHTSYLVMGSLVLDIDGPRLDAKFLTLDGQTNDYFTILKDTSDFRLTTIQFANGDVIVTWASRPGKSYRVEFAPNLAASFTPVSDLIPATGPTTSWLHQPPPGAALGFYRAQELE
jgi:hypothetical protein